MFFCMLCFIRFWNGKAWCQNQICKWCGTSQSKHFYCECVNIRSLFTSDFCLNRNSKQAALQTRTQTRSVGTWRPSTSGQSMDWPSRRSGTQTTRSARRSLWRTRCECTDTHFTKWVHLLLFCWQHFVFHRSLKDWSWPLTRPSHPTLGTVNVNCS